MTENKSVLMTLQNALECATDEVTIEDLEYAINAVNEIQSYRAIGTVEGYERAIQSSIENYNLYREYKAKVQAFEAIGTVEEFKALKEKDTPKKPIIKEWCPAICPNCKRNLSESRGDGYWVHYTSLERCDCGQALDWSE